MTAIHNLAYKLMTIGPVLLTLGIAVSSRSQAVAFDTVADSHELDARIRAYVQPVRDTETVIPRMDRRADAAKVRVVAREWIGLTARGVLKPIPPAGFEDSTREGVKGEIVKCVQDIVTVLNTSALREARQGDLHLAMNDALLALQVGAPVKYSDFSSVAVIGMGQRRSAALAKLALVSLPVAEREQYAGKLKGALGQSDALGTMAAMARLQFVDYQRRRGVDPILIQETDRVVANQAAFKGTSDLPIAVTGLRKLALANRDNGADSILSVARLGFVSEMETNKRINEAVTASKSKAAPVTIKIQEQPKIVAPSADELAMRFQQMASSRFHSYGGWSRRGTPPAFRRSVWQRGDY